MSRRLFELLVLPIFFGLCSWSFATTDTDRPRLRASPTTIGSSLLNEKILSLTSPHSKGSSRKTPSPVFFISSAHVVTAPMKIDPHLVRRMLDALLCAVTHQSDTKKGWQSLLKVGREGDRIGIKVSTEPGVLAGTHLQLVEALVNELIEAGVERDHIFIGDRRRQDLEAAGFTKRPGWSLRWMEYGNGYDAQQTFVSPLIGQLVYGDFAFKESPSSFEESLVRQGQWSSESHYALLVTQEVDKIINLPSLCDSWYTGLHGALANMSIGVIDNWRRFVKGPYFGSPYIAEIYQTEQIRPKVMLTIMDGLMLQYAGGPQPNPSDVVAYGMLLASQDPVALDATALKLINQKRASVSLSPIRELASHIQSAEAAGLGKGTHVVTIRVRER